MQRRDFVASAAASLAGSPAASQGNAVIKFGIDVFSIRSQGWSPFEYLDYCAKQEASVVFFSEVRFLGSLEEHHLKRLREHASRLGLSIEIGMRSVCPTSKSFDASQGTAEEQLVRMIAAAGVVNSPLVRAFLGTSADRAGPVSLEGHIENTVRVLKSVRSRAMDANLKIAIENHAGDMQARELKTLVEEAGKEFVGVCLDSGNPAWTIEDPLLTLETLAPYAVTSGIRDSAVWRVPEGVAVRWVRMGDGNVRIDDWVRRYVELCPGRSLCLEIIVVPQARIFPCFDPSFWEGYRKTPAWEFSRFLALAEKGRPIPNSPPVSKEQAAEREREDLEACIRYTRNLLGI